MNVKNKELIHLRGRVKFPTGGNKGVNLLAREPQGRILVRFQSRQ